MSIWRQARAIALLPGTVTVLVPAAVLIGTGWNLGWGLEGMAVVLPVLFGSLLVVAGFSLWLWTVHLFARFGKGTLAPWDPTRKLVLRGPYLHVRNPMIAAVLAVLAGEGALLGSVPLLIWCAVFFVLNHAFFLLYEEPGLERRFGEEYRAYRRNVPRWLPRRTAWVPVGLESRVPQVEGQKNQTPSGGRM